ncbi:MAG: sirohydrochlorin chelatase [Acidovorax sp.]|uniref:sirohydrochlorin chelatase n=1 Tax=Acidovorax sp. TaxID=1872122 RepID=UPI00391AB9F5
MQQAQAAIILFAHGSRDPLWRLPMEAVAARIADQQPGRPVLCAYLELCTPSLADAAQQLAAQGATQVTVVPMFLGTGKHAREDLPLLVQDLRAAHPGVQFHVQTAIGEDPRMTALMAEIACEAPRT